MKTLQYKRVLLKISGEGLCEKASWGIDGAALEKIAYEIKQVYDSGVQLCIVVGGGNIIRGNELSKVTNIHEATTHYMGMLGTVINALAIQETLESMGMETRVQSAVAVDRVCEKFIRRRAIRHLEKGRIVIFGGGTGNPYVTTDTCAALRATEVGAEVVLKATKVDGVYDSDPVKNPDAVKFDHLTFDEAIHRKLKVMDISAIDMCRNADIPIIVFNMHESGNMRRVVEGEPIGTRITAE